MLYLRHIILLIFLSTGLLQSGCSHLFCQQIVDDSFQLPEIKPVFRYGQGPVVLIDAYHNNPDLIDGRYRHFGQLLQKDGYRIEKVKKSFTSKVLSKGKILVTVNPLNKENVGNWKLPVVPAFSPAEIKAISKWVYNGGSLFLTADHMPFPGASEKLALEFGVVFTNGFAIDTIHWDPIVFRNSDASLASHPITNGSYCAEKIDSLATFWGQAFRTVNPNATGLLVFGQNVVSFNPDTAWRFNEHTPVIPVQGWLQAAALTYGNGRVLIFGDASLFAAQLLGPNRMPMGMNSPLAKQNLQFTLNCMRWLSGLLPTR